MIEAISVDPVGPAPYVIGGPAHAPISDEWYRESILQWAHADCHALTLALHVSTGWEILTLCDGNRGGSIEDGRHSFLVHSGVITPAGDFLDARGICPQEMLDRYARDFYCDGPPAWAGADAAMLRERLVKGTLARIGDAREVIAGHLAHLIELPMRSDIFDVF
jgi:hypothetical protein